MVSSGQYLQKVNNFLVILDASGSIRGSQYDEAREFVRRMNLMIPDLKLKSGLRSFGSSSDLTYMLYGMADYDKAKFNAALPASAGYGLSPLAESIAAAGSDLKETSGKSALIVVSDGNPHILPMFSAQRSGPEAAEAIKKQYGDRLCIYTVHVGGSAQGKETMDKIAKAGVCGFAVRAADIMSPEGMANFVERAFLEKAPPPPLPPKEKDSDNDGVPDSRDKCPGTPAGVAVDKDGCPPDSDKDGVPDYLDKCPGTPAGVAVDKDGCPSDSDKDGVPNYLDKCPGTPVGTPVGNDGCPIPPQKVSIAMKIEFDTGKADIKSEYLDDIAKVADFLKKYPNTKGTIEGHTDNVGRATMNQRLSEKRAENVMNLLVQKFGIDPARLSTKGYGMTRPAASNKTAEGRQKNRRIEAVFDAMVVKK